MDITLLREIVTVISFITFIGIMRYALHPSNKARFDEAAVDVLKDDDGLTPAPSQGRGRQA